MDWFPIVLIALLFIDIRILQWQVGKLKKEIEGSITEEIENDLNAMGWKPLPY